MPPAQSQPDGRRLLSRDARSSCIELRGSIMCIYAGWQRDAAEVPAKVFALCEMEGRTSMTRLRVSSIHCRAQPLIVAIT